MAPTKIRKAIGAVKDHTSIGLVRVGGSNSLSDLEIAIIKATLHNESLPHERHIRKIICLTTYSRPMVTACVAAIAKRLNKTRNWVVVLKTLMLIHRLVDDGDHTYEEEIYFTTRRGMRFLSMSGFRDSSCNSSSRAFVHTYALYLDEQLEFRMQCWTRKRGCYVYQGANERELVAHGRAASSEMVVRATPVHEMQNEDVFTRAQHLMQLLERFLACRLTGAAKCNRVVAVALYPIVTESFKIFYDMTEVIATLIDRFMQLEVPDMVKVHEIFSFVAKQYDELDAFYDWCKSVGIMHPSKFPAVEKISKAKLDTMDDFICQKSELLQNRKVASCESEMLEEADEGKPNKDEHVTKALSPVDMFIESTDNKDEKTFEATEAEKEKKIQDIGDLLNLGEDAPSTEEPGHALALALFGGLTTAPAESTTNPWEAYKNSSEDWESELVQSASYLSNQIASLPGGFNTLMLDGMYQHGAMDSSSYGGSASSIAFWSNGKTAMLALPAPPTANEGANRSSSNTDPFAASLAIAPPAYVQMSTSIISFPPSLHTS